MIQPVEIAVVQPARERDEGVRRGSYKKRDRQRGDKRAVSHFQLRDLAFEDGDARLATVLRDNGTSALDYPDPLLHPPAFNLSPTASSELPRLTLSSRRSAAAPRHWTDYQCNVHGQC